ncbi:hypothetical protein KVH02_30640 [Streptomyces olivaceus]|uniref:hypothetical protein n=1 Tax=Streptomyces olivaceus TaxID=47716 RepID=UPI001CCD07D8|nr:hypothetical protein [Streptomyces olivaceus]MBZ6092639.1 hypothetical protein [Streptomyces olivaceus]
MEPARAARRAVALGLGGLWWWAVLRLALEPGAGVIEGAVAVGGWGLSVLPVHCAPRRRARGALEAGRWRRALRTAARGPGPAGSDGPDGTVGANGPTGRGGSAERPGSAKRP